MTYAINLTSHPVRTRHDKVPVTSYRTRSKVTDEKFKIESPRAPISPTIEKEFGVTSKVKLLTRDSCANFEITSKQNHVYCNCYLSMDPVGIRYRYVIRCRYKTYEFMKLQEGQLDGGIPEYTIPEIWQIYCRSLWTS